MKYTVRPRACSLTSSSQAPFQIVGPSPHKMFAYPQRAISPGEQFGDQSCALGKWVRRRTNPHRYSRSNT
jgi:hypothetical protein